MEAMTHLRVFDETGGAPLTETRDPGAIAAALAPIGVRFEQWPSRPLAADAGQEEVLEAFAPEVERLKAEKGYRSVDVIRMVPDHPERGALRSKFLSEHRHSEDEVPFSGEGGGRSPGRGGERFWAGPGGEGAWAGGRAAPRHWFDMGPSPRFTAIRLFTNADGWIANFTGDTIADRFPRHELV